MTSSGIFRENKLSRTTAFEIFEIFHDFAEN